jgi:hypothetical protein
LSGETNSPPRVIGPAQPTPKTVRDVDPRTRLTKSTIASKR